MSGHYSREAVIRCDTCAETIGEMEITITQLRKSGQYKGWKHIIKFDYCPKCVKRLMK